MFDAARAMSAVDVAIGAYEAELAVRARLRDLASAHTFVVANSDLGSTVGVLALRQDCDVLIGVSGLDSLYDWVMTAKANPRGSFFDDRLLVHAGFDAMAKAADAVVRDWLPARGAGVTNALFVGHSAGGAVAQHVANAMRRRDPDFSVSVMTFGAPKLYAAATASLARGAEHFVTVGDIVPTVPPARYVSVGRVYRLGPQPGQLASRESAWFSLLATPSRLWDLAYGAPPAHFMETYAARLSRFH